jgi:hypothetical protein
MSWRTGAARFDRRSRPPGRPTDVETVHASVLIRVIESELDELDEVELDVPEELVPPPELEGPNPDELDPEEPELEDSELEEPEPDELELEELPAASPTQMPTAATTPLNGAVSVAPFKASLAWASSLFFSLTSAFAEASAVSVLSELSSRVLRLS